MKIDVLDLKGKKDSEMTLNEVIFGGPVHKVTLGQYIRTFLFNRRQGTSSAKTRSEVSGSGAKPWRQKGTGRARVGDKRNPIWRHGGISHGPKPKTWRLGMNKNAKLVALTSALSHKLSSGRLVVIDGLENHGGKTKDAAKMLNDLNLKGKLLFVLDSLKPETIKSLKNIKNLELADSYRLNPVQVMLANTVVFSKKAVKDLEERVVKK